MKDLKSKLSNKVDAINVQYQNSNTINESSNEIIGNDNLVLLKDATDLKEISMVPDFEITLIQAKDRIKLLQNFVKEMMIPNVDYGLIPKCDKPTLFKSGAEKLCDVFGFSKHFEILNRVENWEKGIFHYEIVSTLINKRTGLIESQGMGSCNNMERKYKTQDPFSILNTILKMAKKRAFVDAVLSATRTSGLFTQDIEDDYSREIISEKSPNSSANITTVTQNQLNEIVSLVNLKKISVGTIKSIMFQRYKIDESKHLSQKQADDLISYLKQYNHS